MTNSFTAKTTLKAKLLAALNVAADADQIVKISRSIEKADLDDDADLESALDTKVSSLAVNAEPEDLEKLAFGVKKLRTAAAAGVPTSTEVPEGSSNLYVTEDRVRSSFSASGDLAYDSATGVLSYTALPDALVVYPLVSDLPASGIAAGAKGIVEENKKLYIFTGASWVSVGLVDQTPSFTIAPEASYTLNPAADTVITLAATDPQGDPLTWSHEVTSGALGGSVVSQADNVFTVTGSSDTNDTAPFSIAFRVSDGTNIAEGTSEFTISFAPPSIFYPLTGETSDPTTATWRSNYAPATYVYDTTPGAEGIRVDAGDPITSMRSMFSGSSINNSDISSWDVSTVTNMQQMFDTATIFNQDISSWDMSSVTGMTTMFDNATSFNNGGVALNGNFATTLNLSGQSLGSVFSNCSAFNQDISGWNTTGVTSTYQLFNGCTAFNQDISSWDTSSVTDMQRMFRNAAAFDQNLNAWDVTNIASPGPSNFATGATLFTVDEHPIWGTSGGILYPLSNTATDPTNTTWRTANPTYTWAANVGILMPTGSPITNMNSMFNGSAINDPDISSWDTSTVTSMWSTFINATSFNQDLSSWSLSGIAAFNNSNLRGLDRMFQGATSFNNGGVALTWNTSTVEYMYGMFNGATSFNADISTWNTANVINMGFMFNNASSFNQDISGWDTGLVGTDNSGTTQDMLGMFNGASAFNQNLNAWDVTNIASLPSSFATGATLFTTGEYPIWGTSGAILYPLSNTATDPTYSAWRTANPMYQFIANVGILMPAGSPITSMSEMFRGSAINDPDISTWDVSTVTNMYRVFLVTTAFNQDISSWDVSNVTTMETMFGGSAAFNQDISSWDVSAVTNMEGMFGNTPFDNGGVALNGNFASTMSNVTNMHEMFVQTPTFNQNIGSWNVSSVTDMEGMFRNASTFNQDISSWNVSSVTTMRNMFNSAPAFNNGGVTLSGNFASTMTSVNNMQGMFVGASVFDQDISSWNVSLIASKPANFDDSTPASWLTTEKPIWGTSGGILYPLSNTATDLTTATWRSANPTYQFIANVGILMPAGSPITNTYRMFKSTTFNDPDISSWDVSTVTNMESMFFNADVFNQPLSSWNVSNVTNMKQVFGYTDAFNQDISSWDVSNVTSMLHMFEAATAFNNGGVALDWGTGTANVTNMERMFMNAAAFDQDISSWDVSSVTNMEMMFQNASAFDQDISSWNVLNISSLPTSFDTSTPASWLTAEKPQWGTDGTYSYSLSSSLDTTQEMYLDPADYDAVNNTWTNSITANSAIVYAPSNTVTTVTNAGGDVIGFDTSSGGLEKTVQQRENVAQLNLGSFDGNSTSSYVISYWYKDDRGGSSSNTTTGPVSDMHDPYVYQKIVSGKFLWQPYAGGWTSDAGCPQTTSTTMSDGNWHHILIAYDNGIVTFYVDGVYDSTHTNGAYYLSSNGDRYLAMDHLSETRFNVGTDGCIGAVRLFSADPSSLVSADFVSVYNVDAEKYGLTPIN